MKMKMKTEEEFYEYANRIKKEWQKSIPRYSEKELMEIFPEAKEVIPLKIKEYEKERGILLSFLKNKLTEIKNISDPFSKFFWREWVKINEGQELLEADKNIARLKRLLSVGQNKHIKGQLTEDQIERALARPIERLMDQETRNTGKNISSRCPFHQDKNPSFYIYPETNSFYCFGCNKGGNVINFVEIKYGYSFKQAVEYLTE